LSESIRNAAYRYRCIAKAATYNVNSAVFDTDGGTGGCILARDVAVYNLIRIVSSSSW
jgi:hypothetical protein